MGEGSGTAPSLTSLRGRYPDLGVQHIPDADDVWVRDVPQDSQLAEDALRFRCLDKAIVYLLDRHLLVTSYGVPGCPHFAICVARESTTESGLLDERAARVRLTSAAAEVVEQVVARLKVVPDAAEELVHEGVAHSLC